MTGSGAGELGEDLVTTVRAVPGVTGVFRAGTVVSRVIDASARVLGIRDADAELIRLEPGPEGIGVGLAIGVLASAGAVETARRTSEAIRAFCAERRVDLVGLDLTVVHVDGGAPAGAGRR